MADVVRDAIAAELALIVPVVATPAAPFGYGADISCRGDLAEDMHEVDGLEALADSCFRRLDSPRGSIPDALGDGISLTDYLNVGWTDQELRSLGSKIRGELRKDDRIDTVDAVVEPNLSGSEYRVRITVVPVDPKLGPFGMTLAVTSAGVVLEAMGRRTT